MECEYIHGGDVYGKNVKYDFSININPIGMPESSKEAILKGIKQVEVYPDYNCTNLKKKIAQKKALNENQILIGNGAAEVIFALCQMIRPKNALAVAPCFGEYEKAVKSVGGKMYYNLIFPKDDFIVQESFLLEIQKHIDLVFICNPNNPTGKRIPKKLLELIIERCRETDTYLCVDECFLPFGKEEKEETLLGNNYEKLIVLRAFTKIYGMPGIRLGYAYFGSEKEKQRVSKVLQPWNVSVLAQLAGEAAIEEEEYLKKTWELVKVERAFLKKEMEKGLCKKVYDSDANFLLFEAEKDLAEKFLERKIMIRDCSNFPNLTKGFFRICVGKHEKNLELLRCWKEIRLQGGN